MINTEQTYELLNEWFKKYTSSYFCENELQNKAVSLKVEHTYRVCEHSKDICKSINGSDELCFLSSIIALFHDIGRFEQFKRYKTFADRVSVNHSELGIEILKNNDVLSNLTREQVQYVLTAIAFHNVKKLPSEIDGFQSELCKIIRKLLLISTVILILRRVILLESERMLQKMFLMRCVMQFAIRKALIIL
jgi:hypothetical protein